VNDSAASSGDQAAPNSADIETVERGALIARLDAALETPPVGIILIELLIDQGKSSGQGQTTRENEALLDEAVLQRIAEQAEPGDSTLCTGPGGLALIRSATSAPAETEGLAYRVQKSLVDAVSIGDWQLYCQAAIGVATSLKGDTGEVLLRYAEHALGDARMLGADTVVVFDDLDRELLHP